MTKANLAISLGRNIGMDDSSRKWIAVSDESSDSSAGFQLGHTDRIASFGAEDLGPGLMAGVAARGLASFHAIVFPAKGSWIHEPCVASVIRSDRDREVIDSHLTTLARVILQTAIEEQPARFSRELAGLISFEQTRGDSDVGDNVELPPTFNLMPVPNIAVFWQMLEESLGSFFSQVQVDTEPRRVLRGNGDGKEIYVNLHAPDGSLKKSLLVDLNRRHAPVVPSDGLRYLIYNVLKKVQSHTSENWCFRPFDGVQNQDLTNAARLVERAFARSRQER